jgi:hypothetical protein
VSLTSETQSALLMVYPRTSPCPPVQLHWAYVDTTRACARCNSHSAGLEIDGRDVASYQVRSGRLCLTDRLAVAGLDGVLINETVLSALAKAVPSFTIGLQMSSNSQPERLEISGRKTMQIAPMTKVTLYTKIQASAREASPQSLELYMLVGEVQEVGYYVSVPVKSSCPRLLFNGKQHAKLCYQLGYEEHKLQVIFLRPGCYEVHPYLRYIGKEEWYTPDWKVRFVVQ